MIFNKIHSHHCPRRRFVQGIYLSMSLFQHVPSQGGSVVVISSLYISTNTMSRIFVALLVALCASCSHAFQSLRSANSIRSTNTRVNENFGFKFAEDPYENTPDTILGEVNLKDGDRLFISLISLLVFINDKHLTDIHARSPFVGFVKSYKPDALLLSNVSFFHSFYSLHISCMWLQILNPQPHHSYLYILYIPLT